VASDFNSSPLGTIMEPKIQFNSVGGLRTHINFTRIGAQHVDRVSKESRYKNAFHPWRRPLHWPFEHCHVRPVGGMGSHMSVTGGQRVAPTP
jgi:hypothetical protein